MKDIKSRIQHLQVSDSVSATLKNRLDSTLTSLKNKNTSRRRGRSEDPFYSLFSKKGAVSAGLATKRDHNR